MRRLYIFALLAVTLAFTAAACSSGNYYRQPYPDNRYDRTGYGAGYDRVRQLAYDLERTTDYLKEEVKNDRYDSRNSNYIKDRIEDFDDEAEDFRNEVDHNRDPRNTQDDFRDLQKHYFEARNALQGGSGYGGNYSYLYRDFDRANRIMSELNRFYGYDSYSNYRRY